MQPLKPLFPGTFPTAPEEGPFLCLWVACAGAKPLEHLPAFPPSLGRDQEEDISLLRSFFSTPDSPFGSKNHGEKPVHGMHNYNTMHILLDMHEAEH